MTTTSTSYTPVPITAANYTPILAPSRDDDVTFSAASALLHLPGILRDTIIGLLQQGSRDLTARQLAVLLICDSDKSPPSVTGLAARLGIPAASVTRSIDRLEQFGLLMRHKRPADRRSVAVKSTKAGRAFVAELRMIMEAAAASARRLSK